MANYIVGDIQGCYSGLRELLREVKFSPKKDKLWAVGDLIARGPESLETIKYLMSLGDSFDTVLGNHDLHFLAICNGYKQAKKSDCLEDLLSAKKLPKYIAWLRTKPLASLINKHTLLTHAGLYPKWGFSDALARSEEFSTVLQGPQWLSFLSDMYGSQPNIWDDELQGNNRLRFIVNAMTRMRYLKPKATLEFAHKIPPALNKGTKLTPWFEVKNSRLKSKQRVIFGHWAALQRKTSTNQFIALDTGYVWGNQLTLHKHEKNKNVSIGNVKKF